jgi:RNA-splicing ligase RtcB
MAADTIVYTGELPWSIRGEYAEANIYLRTYDPDVLTQVYAILNCPAFKGQKVALMPDAHVGASGPCGLVATIGDYVCPEHIGVDIGCSVSMMILDKPIPEDKYVELEHKVKTGKDCIPFGMEIYDETIIKERDFYAFLSKGFRKYKSCWPEMLNALPGVVDEKWISDVLKRVGADPARFYKSLGTVGGGNHFIEYGVSEDGSVSAFTLHFGSRNFGKKVCEYWTRKAATPVSKKDVREILREATRVYKEEYKKTHTNMREFKSDLDVYLKNVELSVTNSDYITGYLNGEEMKGYLCDMCLAQLYAQYNHLVVQERIEKLIKPYNVKVKKIITSVHNFIDLEDHCLRKSAIRSYEGEEMIVPFNMRDGVAVCEGRSNPSWLNSCAHGAGRIMSRKSAERLLREGEFTMEGFKEDMKGIVSTSVVPEVIDECPRVYKDWKEIADVINGTCEIKYFIKPRINWKACDGGGKDS